MAVPLLAYGGYVVGASALTYLGFDFFSKNKSSQDLGQTTEQTSKLDNKQDVEAKQDNFNITETYNIFNDNKNFSNSFNGASNIDLSANQTPKIESKATPQITSEATPQTFQIPQLQQVASATSQNSLLENPFLIGGAGLLAYFLLRGDKK